MAKLNQRLLSALLADDEFLGPVERPDDPSIDDGYFSPKGDPYEYKFLDSSRMGFRHRTSGEAGILNLADVYAKNPGWFNQEEVRSAAKGNIDALAKTISDSRQVPLPPSDLEAALAGPNLGDPYGNMPDAYRYLFGVGTQEGNQSAPEVIAQSGRGAAAQPGRPDAPPIQAVSPRPPASIPGSVPESLSPAPSPVDQLGEGGLTLSKALETPLIQKALADLGAAIGGKSPGGRIAAAAGGIIDASAESQYLSRLLGGEDVASIERDLVGISPQARQRAFQAKQQIDQQALDERKVAAEETRAEASAETARYYAGSLALRIAEHEFDVEKYESGKAHQEIMEGLEQEAAKVGIDVDRATIALTNARTVAAGQEVAADRNTLNTTMLALSRADEFVSGLEEDIKAGETIRLALSGDRGAIKFLKGQDYKTRDFNRLALQFGENFELLDAMKEQLSSAQLASEGLLKELNESLGVTYISGDPTVDEAARLEVLNLPPGTRFVYTDKETGKQRTGSTK